MRRSPLIATKRPLPKSHPRNRPSGASPKPKSQPRAIPGWLWMVAGLGIGVLLMSLVKLASAPTKAGVEPKSTPVPAVAEKPVQADAKPVASPAPDDQDSAKPTTKFDFYTLLPEQEVIEPNERPEPAPTKAGATQKAQPVAPTNTAAPGEAFILQAGSFRSATEADRRRAQVQALGLPTRQESVSAGGDTWYRVLVGPFPSRDAVSQARDKLAGQGIDTIVVRKKTAG